MASLLLTRPHRQSKRFRALVGRDAPTVISPLLRIEPLEPSLPDVFSGVVVTSANGAAALARLGIDPSLPVLAVGSRTAEVAHRAGYRARSADGDADDLVRMILHDRPAGTLLHLRGAETRGDVARRLTAAGVSCAEAIAYRQLPEPLTAEARHLLAAPEAVVVPLFSPGTGSILAAQGPFVAPLRLVCMSEAVAQAVAGLPVESLTVAAGPDAAAMAANTRDALDA